MYAEAAKERQREWKGWPEFRPTFLGTPSAKMDSMRPTLTWRPWLGVGIRGVSADHQREYFVQRLPGLSPACGWWMLTASTDKCHRHVVGSCAGAILLGQSLEEAAAAP